MLLPFFLAVTAVLSLESRYRQTTAQSSTLAVGYFILHARVAESTRIRAAEDLGDDATIATTSLFERTSQTCGWEQVMKIETTSNDKSGSQLD